MDSEDSGIQLLLVSVTCALMDWDNALPIGNS